VRSAPVLKKRHAAKKFSGIKQCGEMTLPSDRRQTLPEFKKMACITLSLQNIYTEKPSCGKKLKKSLFYFVFLKLIHKFVAMNINNIKICV